MGHDAALRQVEPDVRVHVVSPHNLQQDLIGHSRPPGVEEGDPDVVEDLTLRHPARVASLASACGLLSVQSVQSVLKIIHSEVWLLHDVMQTAEVVVIMREHTIA